MDKMNIQVDNRSFSVSNLDKVFWPEEKYTKGNLIKYYMEISPYIIKYLQDRPIVFTRYPDGIKGKHFYQKNAPEYLPEWIDTYSIYSSETERNIDYILIKEPAVLVWLANHACIEIHPWLSRINNLENPDYLAIDLDPSPANTFQQIIDIALSLKHILDELKLRSYLKTSGSEGLHIYIPVANIYTYKEIRDLGKAIASMIVGIRPDISTIERTVNKRGSKIYIDYMQNVRGKTLCSVYSVRPRKGAPVSAPLRWEEIPRITPADFTIKTILPRVKELGDLFTPLMEERQTLDYAREKLGMPQLVNK